MSPAFAFVFGLAHCPVACSSWPSQSALPGLTSTYFYMSFFGCVCISVFCVCSVFCVFIYVFVFLYLYLCVCFLCLVFPTDQLLAWHGLCLVLHLCTFDILVSLSVYFCLVLSKPEPRLSGPCLLCFALLLVPLQPLCICLYCTWHRVTKTMKCNYNSLVLSFCWIPPPPPSPPSTLVEVYYGVRQLTDIYPVHCKSPPSSPS